MFAQQLGQTEQRKHLEVHIAHHMRRQGSILSPHKQAYNQQQIYLKECSKCVHHPPCMDISNEQNLE